ncbi:MAG: putative serine protease, partial [uncultured Actinomycetospora sp.]
ELGRRRRRAARARRGHLGLAPRARRRGAELPRRARWGAAGAEDRAGAGGRVRGHDLADRGQRPGRRRAGGAGRDPRGVPRAGAARPDAPARRAHGRLGVRLGAPGHHRADRRLADRAPAGRLVADRSGVLAEGLPRARGRRRRHARPAAPAAQRAARAVRRLGLPRRPEPLLVDAHRRGAPARAGARRGPGGAAGARERAQGPGPRAVVPARTRGHRLRRRRGPRDDQRARRRGHRRGVGRGPDLRRRQPHPPRARRRPRRRGRRRRARGARAGRRVAAVRLLRRRDRRQRRGAGLPPRRAVLVVAGEGAPAHPAARTEHLRERDRHPRRLHDPRAGPVGELGRPAGRPAGPRHRRGLRRGGRPGRHGLRPHRRPGPPGPRRLPGRHRPREHGVLRRL